MPRQLPSQESNVYNILALCLLLLAGTVTAQEAAVVFKDVSSDTGLQLGGGAACWADIDNDGWVDVCAGAVWKNNKGKSFSKIGDISPGSVIAADFDNDGFVDLFSWSSMKLFRNKGGKEFVDVPLPDLPRIGSRGAVWADLNNDSFVDLYVGGYEGSERSLLILINEGGKSFRVERGEGEKCDSGRNRLRFRSRWRCRRLRVQLSLATELVLAE